MVAVASVSYWGDFAKRYPTFASAQGNSCYASCHSYENTPAGDYYGSWKAAVTAKNPGTSYFGGLASLVVDQAYLDIEYIDSDGDGYTNLAEILSGTRPGDVANKPAYASPSAPGNVTAVAGNGQVTVSFAASSNTGPYLNYQVTVSPGGQVVKGQASPLVVTGLTNGTPYSFTVAADNGKLPAVTALAVSATPELPLNVVSDVRATAGNGQASVAFTPPLDGSSSYTVRALPGNVTATGTASPIVVPGLANGSKYRFTVTPAGTGALASSLSNEIIPNVGGFAVPDAPSANGANAGHEMAVIAVSPPFDGGTPITSYTALCNYSLVQGVTLSFSFNSPKPLIILTGLTNGVTYKCGLVASNAVGSSTPPNPQSYSIQIIPGNTNPPGLPADLSVEPGNAAAVLSFAPPANNGGSPVLDYTAYCLAGHSSGFRFATHSVTGSSSPLRVTGLTNGTTYDCWVVARNEFGTFFALEHYPDPFSVTPVLTAPPTAPGAPTALQAAAGDAKATVSFSAPAADGGRAITRYIVTASPGSTSAAGDTSPIVVSGLSNGTAYTFTVVAQNSVGSSGSSAASASVTPNAAVVAVPDMPNCCAFVDAGNGMAILAFDAPTANGSPITSYTATCSYSLVQGVPLTLTASSPSSPLIIEGLTNGVAYQCKLTATNGAGTSLAPFFATAQFTPHTPAQPGVPTGIAATPGNGQISMAFAAPVNDGGSVILDYTASCKSATNTVIATGTQSPLLVTGLTNDVPHACWVTARNAQGTFNALKFRSATVSATPGAAVVTTTTTTTTTSTTAAPTTTTTTLAPTATTTTTSTTLALTATTTTTSTTLAPTATTTTTSTTLAPTATTTTTSTTLAPTTTTTTTSSTAAPTTSTTSTTASTTTTTLAVTGVPDTPSCCAFVDAGNTMAILAFDPGVDNGSPITSYTATCSYSLVQGVPLTVSASSLASPLILEGLHNGVTYQCKLTATNALGTSPAPVNASIQFTPFTPAPPSVPTGISATPGNGQISMAFSASSNDGGSVILDYTAYCKSDTATFTATGTQSPLLVTGLANDILHACWVTARNAQGTFNALKFRSATLAATPTAAGNGTVSMTIPPGWNLLGNGQDQPLVVKERFGDPLNVTTVWKWDTVKPGWQFYAPSMSVAALQTYATAKGYDVLGTINPGEGFWVNVARPFTATLPAGNPLAASDFAAGKPYALKPNWNLVAVGGNVSPRSFNAALGATPPSAGTVPVNLTTLWAWDNATSAWYFYAPTLDGKGGTFLFDYTFGKGYLDFATTGKVLGNGVGFWVNMP
ncbi:MAG: hypothetical protein AUJ20_12775 [Comamonadaceae bacterium CG1_02_60_18]|nr:MAG: hypothetical protein AUJ20_12775 [Comamonadaceae bacterium CG1_02_60_18]